MLGVEPLPAPVSKAAEEASKEAGDAGDVVEEEAETTSSIGTKRDADEAPDSDNCKKIKLEDQ